MRQQPELTVEEVPTDELVPYARNAKVHTNEQIDQIVKSIEEFGFNGPIAVWHNEDGAMEIIEGHGRVMAAKKLGLFCPLSRSITSQTTSVGRTRTYTTS